MYISGQYADALWRQYLEEPSRLPPDWRNAFEFISHLYEKSELGGEAASPAEAAALYLRRFGHLHADLDPLGLTQPAPLPEVAHGGALASAYQGALAVETGHLDNAEMAAWVTAEFERLQHEPRTPSAAVAKQLIETEALDQFLAVKYPTKKRFGGEGADAIMAMLHALHAEAAARDVDEIVFGSMHRGRYAVLTNFLGIEPQLLISLINGAHPFRDQQDLPADVPYHAGLSAERDGVRLTLLPNPSHLEAINPLAIGYARARRARGGGRAMAVVLHTDASVVAQGVNSELLQMSALPGFSVGGAIHFVINNQIGFTTEPSEARSSRYCTGPWRAVDSLLLHVNGDDVDAAVAAVGMAMRFRERFERDAVIDLVCYRRNGHNEIDEPRFTQPAYYGAVDAKPTVVRAYVEHAVATGVMSAADAESMRVAAKARLDEAFDAAGSYIPNADEARERATAKPRAEADLRAIIETLSHVPEGAGSAKLIKLMERRLGEVEGGVAWPLAEAMAFGVALNAGVPVRFCGQDIERGAFSQRHFAAISPGTNERFRPLAQLARGGATFEIVNSPLSEYAVLGFEYGYSLAARDALCIWEAQFGDFANGAQIILDQFIASGFEKWRQQSNLVVLLPHGLEGQGPEHSSARIERLLQLAARENIRIVHPSTPANYFHLLCDQAFNGERPLFIVTPKVLLRHPLAKSPLTQFEEGSGFEPVVTEARGAAARRAIVCSGKIAYEVEQAARARGSNAAVVRLEQIYPFPARAVEGALAETGAKEIVWLQEEPENYGAGLWLTAKLAAIAERVGARMLPMVARAESASPAGSFHTWHVRDQEALIDAALGVES